MRNYYSILEVAFLADKKTLRAAYERKVMALINTEAYSEKEKILSDLKWDFSLRLLDQWRMNILDSTLCRELLAALLESNNNNVSPLICDEVKNSLRPLMSQYAKPDLAHQFGCALLDVGREIEQKRATLKQIEEAYSTLTDEKKCLAHNRYILLAEELSKVTPLPSEINDLVIHFTST